MKIRNKHLIRAAGWAASRALLGLVGTVRTEHHCVGPTVVPFDKIPPGERYIYSAWHETLLVPAVHFAHPGVAVLISKHADGQLLAALIRALGMGMVAGSTNRGGVEAARQIVNKTGDMREQLIITTDGPRGPRRVVQPGIVYVSSRAGMPIVPTGVGYRNPWRAKSWDRFAVPKPGSRARILIGAPIVVPPKAKSSEFEPYRLAVQHEMDRLTAAAERWADTGRLDLPAAVEVARAAA